MEFNLPSQKSIEHILACPDCLGNLSSDKENELYCTECGIVFKKHLSIPVLQPKSEDVIHQFSTMNNPIKTMTVSHKSTLTSMGDKIYNFFGKTPFFPHVVANRRGRLGLQQLLSEVKGITLEVGCGEHTAAPFINRKDVTYIPSDYIGWDEVVDMNNQWNGGLMTHPRSRSPLFWADSNKLPLRSSSLDSWIAIEMLEHLPFPEQALLEVSRCLKKNGKAYITVPWLLRVHGGNNDEGDFGRFTRNKLELMAKENGMELVEFFVNTSMWTTLEFLVSGYFIRLIIERVPFRILRMLCGVLISPLFFVLNTLAFLFDGKGDRRFAFRYFAIMEKKF